MMGDGFVSLGLPQSLVIGGTELKEAWHRAAAQAEDAEEIHRAYAVLREPARRIEHLLELHGRKADRVETPGARLVDLFFTVASALENADAVGAQIASAESALQRAGLTPQLLASLDRLTAANAAVMAERSSRESKLANLAGHFPYFSDVEWETLASLGSDFTFLSKWNGELQKRETRLQETLMGKIV